jgi:hypothetical protein
MKIVTCGLSRAQGISRPTDIFCQKKTRQKGITLNFIAELETIIYLKLGGSSAYRLRHCIKENY